MKRGLLLGVILLFTKIVLAQVGINTENVDPSAILDVYATDKGILIPRVELKGTKDEATIASPATGLMVFNTTAAAGGGALGEPVIASHFYYWTGMEWSLLIHKMIFKDVLEELKTPQPVILELENDMINFLSSASAGQMQSTPMKLIVNSIPEHVSFDASTNTLTLKPGTYTMEYVYEALHYKTSSNACTLSSYIVEFPTSADGLNDTRIHSTGAHNYANNIDERYNITDHGGTISCSFKLTNERSWQIALGRGQSGNCTGAGNTLIKGSTHLTVIRYGD